MFAKIRPMLQEIINSIVKYDIERGLATATSIIVVFKSPISLDR